ncbi:hypothetical protein SDRG_03808 [Saprolegnia diclina VS20]|uniref:FYVE-type domain-containing protein n=1 Tax=Saprolegnia diclina (strain VS20) TaxID=1156394 RepID=T0QXR2_SAPDV|nr:hypothetical protein SDRG_03808 [Saprolegnia diclina VS20]EQC38850.1 hypothetical protein SDRG_03808 [Saprolegnia diclina VS20]|eukprot:XP_008607674.1 hypothetical protein SDRG_03808 [Saprolegnia diclina VS20]
MECHVEGSEALRIQAEMQATALDYMARQCPPISRDTQAIDDGFKLATTKVGRVYTRRADNSSFNELLVLNTLPMSLDEVGELQHSSTNDAFRVEMALYYGDDFLDAAILHSSVTASTRDPFQWFGVKYKKLNIPGSGFTDCRDIVYFEYMATAIDAAGHRTLLIVRDSSYLEGYPVQPHVVRMYIKAIFVYTEMPSGEVASMHLAFMNPGGVVPAFLFNKLLIKYGGLCSKFPRFLQQKRLLLRVAADGPAKRHQDHGRCVACNTKISGLKARYNCRACGDVMCAHCIVQVPRPLVTKLAPFVSKDDYCKRCFVGSSRQPSYVVVQSPSQKAAHLAQQLAHSERPRRSKAHALASDSSTRVASGLHHTSPGLSRREAVTTSTNGETTVTTVTKTLDDPFFERMQSSIETQKQIVLDMRERLARQQQHQP